MANPPFSHVQRSVGDEDIAASGWNTTPAAWPFIGGLAPFVQRKLPPSLLSVDSPPGQLWDLVVLPAEDNAAYFRAQKWPFNKIIVSVDNPPPQDDERTAVAEVIYSIWNAPIQPLPQLPKKVAAISVVATSSTADWFSQGVATATFVGAAADVAAWNAIGIGTGAFVGAALDTADWFGQGIATAQFTESTLNTSAWSSTGVATATWNEASFASSVWNAAGSALASWEGAASTPGFVSADWSVTGSASVSWTQQSGVAAVWSSAGTSTAAFKSPSPSTSTITRDGWRVRSQITEKRRRKDEEEIMAIAKAVLPLLQRGNSTTMRITL